MDEHNYRQIDKSISKQIAEIYNDPKRHVFYSQFQAFEDDNLRGIQDGKLRGKKTICFHCGMKREVHVTTTEQL